MWDMVPTHKLPGGSHDDNLEIKRVAVMQVLNSAIFTYSLIKVLNYMVSLTSWYEGILCISSGVMAPWQPLWVKSEE